MGNRQQARQILRYHRHLQRLGRARSLDHTARHWITKYAGLWRKRYSSSSAASAI